MPWQPVETWPGEPEGEGAFRTASEPVLAERRGISATERLRIVWHARPDLPARRVATRIALGATHVFVERRDGSRERVPRSELRGRRVDSGVVVYGVVDAADLLLAERPGCPVEAALLEQVGASEPLRVHRGVLASALVAVAAAGTGVGLLLRYARAGTFGDIGRGMWTSESALGLYGGVAALGLALACVLWLPSRVRIDPTGVERRRGLVPWLAFRKPPTDFEAVEVVQVVGTRRRHSHLRALCYTVELVLRSGRLGAVLSGSRLILSEHSVPVPRIGTPDRSREPRDQATAFAARVARALGVPVRETERRAAHSRHKS